MTSESRFTHVIRICGQNRNGDRIPDIWVDIERQDIVWVNYKEKATGQWQGQFTRLYWMDDPDGDGGATWNADNRLIGTRYICSPDQNSYDPDEFIAVNCIIAFVANENGQELVTGIRSDLSNETRFLSARRIYHRNTNPDFEERAQAAFDGDETRFAYVAAGPDYELKMEDADKDDGQWIDVCVAAQSAFANHDGDFEQQINGHWSDYLLTISDKSSDFLPDADMPNAIGDLGFNPPWVLDQFQNIVNVQFKTHLPKYVAVAGWTGDIATVVLLSVGDNDEIQTLELDDPIPYNGWVSTGASIGVTEWHPAEKSSMANVGAEWKDTFLLAGTYPLFETSDTGSAVVPPPDWFYVDYKGEEFDDPPIPPEKGVLRNGLYGFNRSVAKYEGDTLIWKVEFNRVYEILSGYRVLALDADNNYGLYKLSPDDGSLIEYTAIGDGGAASESDTSSDGTTYQLVAEYTHPGGGTDIDSTLRKYNINGDMLWEVEFDTISFERMSTTDFRPAPFVIENKKGTVFIVVQGMSSVDPAIEDESTVLVNGYQYDSWLDIYNSKGDFVETIEWGHSIDAHSTAVYGESSSIESADAYGADYHHISSICSTLRFPKEPT